jgi:putative FmdB family regulatory protein
MPLFEYVCVRCGERFEHLVRSGRGGAEGEPVCPKCGYERVQKQLSGFAVPGVATAGSSRSDAASCSPGFG